MYQYCVFHEWHAVCRGFEKDMFDVRADLHLFRWLRPCRHERKALCRHPDLWGVKRVLSLYVNFWIVFLLFFPLGYIFNPELFRTSLFDFILNFSSLKYSVNGAWWFLLPYAVLTLFSGRLTSRLYSLDHKSEIVWLSVSLLLYVSAYLALDMLSLSSELLSLFVFAALRLLTLLFVFIVGVLFAKYRLFDKLKAWCGEIGSQSQVNKAMMIVAASLVTLKLFIGSSSLLNPWFVFLLIPCYVMCTHPVPVERFLCFMGRHSTNMWLVHYFFCRFVFGDAIYGLRYPLLIYCVLCILSLGSSFVINMIYLPLKKRIRT